MQGNPVRLAARGREGSGGKVPQSGLRPGEGGEWREGTSVRTAARGWRGGKEV